jgi:nitrous oxidase accessory protein
LTGNISSNSYGIVVERNNTIIDGNGYMLQGSSTRSGIQMANASNIMIRNTNVGNFTVDIDISSSSNITVTNNNLSSAQVGVNFYSSFGNMFSNNIITSTWYGLGVDSSSGNVFSDNNITHCSRSGIILQDSSNNIFAQNNLDLNNFNIKFYSLYFPNSTAGNSFFHNNFLFGIYGGPSSQISNDNNLTQIWDNDHEGNYWSDYNGTDANHDGIGDTPYVIDANNTDHYPLMAPYAIPEFPSFTVLPLFMIAASLAIIVYKRRQTSSRTFYLKV